MDIKNYSKYKTIINNIEYLKPLFKILSKENLEKRDIEEVDEWIENKLGEQILYILNSKCIQLDKEQSDLRKKYTVVNNAMNYAGYYVKPSKKDEYNTDDCIAISKAKFMHSTSLNIDSVRDSKNFAVSLYGRLSQLFEIIGDDTIKNLFFRVTNEGRIKDYYVLRVGIKGEEEILFKQVEAWRTSTNIKYVLDYLSGKKKKRKDDYIELLKSFCRDTFVILSNALPIVRVENHSTYYEIAHMERSAYIKWIHKALWEIFIDEYKKVNPNYFDELLLILLDYGVSTETILEIMDNAYEIYAFNTNIESHSEKEVDSFLDDERVEMYALDLINDIMDVVHDKITSENVAKYYEDIFEKLGSKCL